MDDLTLAEAVVARARRAGATAADAIVSAGRRFSVTVRLGQVETLKDSGSQALGVRVFVGQRSACVHSSDLSRGAIDRLVEDAVAMAQATGDDPAAGLPDATTAPELDEDALELYDPRLAERSTADAIELARRAEAAALDYSDEIDKSQGATYGSSSGRIALANSAGFGGSYRSTSASLSVVPIATRNGAMERDHWYTAGRFVDDLESPEDVGRIAAERVLRRLGAHRVPTQETAVVFDPQTAASLLGHLFGALTGYAAFRDATFLKERVGDVVASPLVTLVDDARRQRGLGTRPFDGEGSPTRMNRPIANGVLRHFLCDSYAARKLGTESHGCARRAVSGVPSVGPSNFYMEAGSLTPDALIRDTGEGLYVTDLIGFGVNLVTGDYSQGAAGQWIQSGQLTHPVNELTIAGNLASMLADIDALADDLDLRRGVAAPTLRVRRLMLSGE